MESVLLNPGPVSLSEGVRKALGSIDLCHREPEFFNLQDKVIKALLGIYRCDPQCWAAVLLGGSGTVAMEAMVTSLVPEEAHVLVLENGVYGERLKRICEIHGIAHSVLSQAWGDPIDLDELARHLTRGDITHVAAVHHETTTGLLNPVKRIADLCENNGVCLLLDAVSSFGAEAIPFDHAALGAIAATANKCLHGIPGLAMVLCRGTLLSQTVRPRSLYLHLQDWAKHQATRSTPYTPPVNALLGLSVALQELDRQGGWKARRARYRKLAGQVAAVLHAEGVEPWLPASLSSCVLRSYHLPAGMDYNALHDGLKQQGFVIYAGQGELTRQLFRISTMGEISDYDMARLEQAIQVVIGG